MLEKFILFTLLAGGGAGIVLWRRLSFSWRILALHFALSASVEILVRILSSRHAQGTLEEVERIGRQATVLPYNLYMPFDFALLLLALGGWLPRNQRKWLAAAYAGWLIIWIRGVLQVGLLQFVYFAILCGAIIILVACLSVLLFSAAIHPGRLRNLPMFWAAVGIALYYACTIPRFAIIPYLMRLPDDNEYAALGFIATMCNALSAGVRYPMVVIGLLLAARQGILCKPIVQSTNVPN